MAISALAITLTLLSASSINGGGGPGSSLFAGSAPGASPNRALDGIRAKTECPKRLERCRTALKRCGPKGAGCETLLEQCRALAVTCQATLANDHGVESMPESWFVPTDTNNEPWDERSYVGFGRGIKPEVEKSDKKRPCGVHGYLDTLGLCKCAVMYGGPNCKSGVTFTMRLPNAWDHALKRVVPMREFKADFHDRFLVSRKHQDFETTGPYVLKLPSYTDNGPGPTKRINLGNFDRGLYETSPPEDPLYGKVYDRCAVVGNSAVLLHMRNGDLIDAHDAVFRFNGAVTEKFKPYVGQKTTFRLVNEEYLDFREKDDEVVLHAPRTSETLTAFTKRASYQKNKERPVYLFTPEFMHLVEKSVMEFEPTIGWTGMLLAMQICRRVDLFGFFQWEQHGMAYHYFDTCGHKRNPAQQERKDDMEWVLVRSLTQMQMLHFMEACVVECHLAASLCEACRARDPSFRDKVAFDSAEHRKSAGRNGANCPKSVVNPQA